MALLRCVAALDDLKLEGDQAVGVTIVKRALEEPIRQIVINAGVEGAVIVMEVKKNKKAAYGFNAATEERLSGAKDDRLCAMPLLLYHLRLFMNALRFVSPRQLQDILLNVAIARPVFIWGAPGIGKSSVVQQFAEQLGLACVSLLGSQLAPEDIIGVPQINEGKSRFCPPAMIARDQPYCLFLDELNACSHEVQKSFYSLIHERRVGDYQLPDGSIIIGAGNRAHDSAIVKPMSSALLNRMVHVHLQVSHRDWLDWAAQNNIHPKVMEYVGIRPDHLWSQPPKHEEPFSTPRSWHMLSDALNHFQSPSASQLEIVAYGCLSPQHAGQFLAFLKQHSDRFMLNRILKGEESWPGKPEDRDLLYFLAQSFRAQLLKELPAHREAVTPTQRQTAHQAKALLKDLAGISLEIAQMMVSDQPNEERLPDWFLVEIVRDLPRLVENRNDGPAG